MSVYSFTKSLQTKFEIQERVRRWCFPTEFSAESAELYLPEAAQEVVEYLESEFFVQIVEALMEEETVKEAGAALVEYMANRNPNPLTVEQLRDRQVRIVLRAAANHIFKEAK